MFTECMENVLCKSSSTFLKETAQIIINAVNWTWHLECLNQLEPQVLQLLNPKTNFNYKLANKNCTLRWWRSAGEIE